MSNKSDNKNIFCRNFIDVYSSKIGEFSVERILNSSKEIVKNYMLDSNNYALNKTGILVGKIQSGKTSNFLGLISVAFDNFYDIAIIFGGKDKTLLNQNTKRVEEVFNNNNRVLVDDDSYVQNIKTISSEDLKNLTSDFFKKKSKLVIVVLKNNKHFENIENFLNINKNILNNKNILIIDDEGDQGTLNGKIRQNKETRWYTEMINLRNACNHFSFILVTATPYANFLIDLDDALLPDFVSTIDSGKGYKGLQDFHYPGSKCLIEINKNEVDFYRNKIINPNEWGINKNKSLVKALSTFIFGSIIRKKNYKVNKSEMIIHIDPKVSIHSELQKQVERILKHYSESANCDQNSIDFRDFMVEFFIPGFKVYFNKEFDIKNSDDFKLLDCFKTTMESIDTVIYNSSNSKKNFNDSNSSPIVIYVGAVLLERGVTFKDLMTVYMSRVSKSGENIDTLLQRARWFGYRDYSDLMRIFLPEVEIENFEIIMSEEEILWDDLGRLNSGEFSNCREWIENLKIVTGYEGTLKPTRKNVTSLDVVNGNSNSLHSWFAQIKYFEDFKTRDSEIKWYEENIILAIEKSFGKGKNDGIEVRHKILNFNNFNNFEQKFNSIKSFVLNKCNINENYWKLYSSKNQCKSVNVIFMYPNNKNSLRTIKDNKLSLFSRGISNDDLKSFTSFNENGEHFYLSDRKIDHHPINKDKVILLIYKFEKLFLNSEDKKNDNPFAENQLTYALYFPNSNLSYTFRRHK